MVEYQTQNLWLEMLSINYYSKMLISLLVTPVLVNNAN